METVPVWLEVATRFGLPTGLLGFFIWLYLKVTADHAKTIKDKDDEIAKLHRDCQLELARVNDLRVKESREHADRMYDRDVQTSELLTNMDKALTALNDNLLYRKGPIR